MKLARSIGLCLSVALIAVLVGGFGGNPAHAEEATIITYGGHVTGDENVFVAVVVEGEDTTVYICDGLAEKGTVSIAEWFIGKVKDNAIDITGPTGNRVTVALTDTTATGKFTFAAGAVKEFVVGLLPKGSGLFRSEFSLGTDNYIGGWLVLEDGSVRGAVRHAVTGVLVPANFKIFAPYLEQDN